MRPGCTHGQAPSGLFLLLWKVLASWCERIWERARQRSKTKLAWSIDPRGSGSPCSSVSGTTPVHAARL